MGETTVLVANRGEVAIRVIRAAADLGMRSCAVYSRDDEGSLHTRRADTAHALPAAGPAAYLDAGAILAAADEAGADLVHPGYGFLSEDAAFARRCAEHGVTFVGPSPEVLDLFGDKAAARRLAADNDVPVATGTGGAIDLESARAFLRSLPDGAGIVLKAVAGGGGRGMRGVHDEAALEEAFEQCRSEAERAFGRGDLYAERLVARARHVEVQVVGDGGSVAVLGARDCSLQRRHQKLVEIAPPPGLPADLTAHLAEASRRLAGAVGFSSLGTFEFLVRDPGSRGDAPFVFIEANPRLQVEHTITEEVTGVDLVATQLRLAAGATLPEVGLGPGPQASSRGVAVQARVNAETLEPDGAVHPSGGVVDVFEPPTGPGVRTDTSVHAGYETNPAFDSLLAKVVAHDPGGDTAAALRRLDRALGELRVEGVATNIGMLRELVRHPDVAAGRTHTRFVEDHLADLLPADAGPLDGSGTARAGATGAAGESGAVVAPTRGTVIRVDTVEGDEVTEGAILAVLEAMKMEHVVRSPTAGVVRRVLAREGVTVNAGDPVALVEPADVQRDATVQEEAADPDAIRDDLREVLDRQQATKDEARPAAVEKRHDRGQRTVRENIAALCDPGSFVEYGSLVVAAQRERRSIEELIEKTPADGLVAGIGRVNGDRFGDAARCAVLSYDATVLAGTQGQMNHLKKDRLFEIIERLCLPVVLFAEGGGGRPGDTDTAVVSGLHTMAFTLFARLSGLVPSVGIASRYCFAGNAALLGCCDVIVATQDASIGMGGPAMIEGGGLGSYEPGEIGPVSVQAPNGVVDVVVADEVEAVDVARRYLAFFQGPVDDWECADQRRLRSLVPENRRRVYDVRRVVDTLADTESVLELRREFGRGIVTALVRFEGRPVGLVANDPAHLGGAIDRDGADKAARFMQLCDAFDLPLLFLCDTPGFLVGPDAEAQAQVRHFARMFVTGASLSVPFFTVVLRKGYGLGAQAMAGGSFHAPLFTVAWPTGEFGGMNLEGAVRLGFRRELDAIEDPAEREKKFEEMVELAYEHGKALNVAAHFEIDDVIDPADTRARIVNTLRAAPPPPARTQPKRPAVDPW